MEGAEDIKGLEIQSQEMRQILSQDLISARSDLSSLSSAVDVRYEEARGRFVEANSYIPTGSVILVEEAAVSYARSDTAAQCDKCLQVIMMMIMMVIMIMIMMIIRG